ncbi:hypothetical protein QBC36DRAFT_336058 [Triangularia setosa]|uniref:Uncharacterized protein n=1 Tax=Triangularia setosa TaxID=2587417 RepID=A0AAN6W0V9_9PEZI|nr:hypothetical protein QBC36DRAFT_336058 [Podospora setosa]
MHLPVPGQELEKRDIKEFWQKLISPWCRTFPKSLGCPTPETPTPEPEPTPTTPAPTDPPLQAPVVPVPAPVPTTPAPDTEKPPVNNTPVTNPVKTPVDNSPVEDPPKDNAPGNPGGGGSGSGNGPGSGPGSGSGNGSGNGAGSGSGSGSGSPSGPSPGVGQGPGSGSGSSPSQGSSPGTGSESGTPSSGSGSASPTPGNSNSGSGSSGNGNSGSNNSAGNNNQGTAPAATTEPPKAFPSTAGNALLAVDGTQAGQNDVTQKGASSSAGGGFVAGSGDYTSTDEFGYGYHGEVDQNSGGIRGPASGTGTSGGSGGTGPGSGGDSPSDSKGASPMVGIIGAIVSLLVVLLILIALLYRYRRTRRVQAFLTKCTPFKIAPYTKKEKKRSSMGNGLLFSDVGDAADSAMYEKRGSLNYGTTTTTTTTNLPVAAASSVTHPTPAAAPPLRLDSPPLLDLSLMDKRASSPTSQLLIDFSPLTPGLPTVPSPTIPRRSSQDSIGAASIASSGVFSPSLISWPMPPSTAPSIAATSRPTTAQWPPLQPESVPAVPPVVLSQTSAPSRPTTGGSHRYSLMPTIKPSQPALPSNWVKPKGWD